MRTLSIVIAIASSAVIATPVLAGPTSVAWSSPASSCVPDFAALAAGLASIDPSHGTVTFAPGRSGHIRLTCPVTATFAPNPNASFLTYYNDLGYSGGVNHCTVQVDVLRTNLDNVEHGADISSYSTAFRITTGRQIFWNWLSETLNFDASYYWVDVDLFRDSGAASCNPAVVGTYLAIR